MWTPTKTTSLTTALNSPRHTPLKLDEDLPLIFNYHKYNSLYNCIYETEKIAHKSIQDK